MVLSAAKILSELNKNIFITPFDPSRLNPNSYNLRLADELLVYTDEVLDMAKPNDYTIIQIPKEGYVLQPGKLYLGRTMERTETRKHVPMIEGRSSVGRLGVSIHETAGFGDIGFEGYWTLEISCIQPTRIYAGVDICQIYYHTVKGKKAMKYSSGKYQNNFGVQPSMIWKDKFFRGRNFSETR